MQPRISLVGWLAALAVFGPGAHGSSAQTGVARRTVRVEQSGAMVRSRANLKAEIVAPAPVDTVLDVLERDADWLWVLLPPDTHGTRRPGWIRVSDVEKSAEAADGTVEPEPVKKPKRSLLFFRAKPVDVEAEQAALKPPEAPKPPKPVKEDNRSLEKAKRELDKARRDYEKLATSSSNASVAPVPPPDGEPVLQPTAEEPVSQQVIPVPVQTIESVPLQETNQPARPQ